MREGIFEAGTSSRGKQTRQSGGKAVGEVRDRLIELIKNAKAAMKSENLSCDIARNMFVADFMVANGVTVNEWRLASEPPKEEGSYLVYSCKSKTVFTARYRPRCERWTNRANGQFITHWMPLPQPPKEVE